MIYIICITAFFASLLTFFSGFGLGTLLMPVFALFFPVEKAIAATAIVHFTNNIFKSFLIFKNINKSLILRFGISAFIFSFIGASLLQKVSQLNAIYIYDIESFSFEITPVKIVAGILMIFFAFFDLIPSLSSIQIDKKYLIPGGMLSGFFGGFSGHQGAFRSAFLIKSGISKKEFIATGTFISLFVDVSRIGTYSFFFNSNQHLKLDLSILMPAALSAIVGALIGFKWLEKISLKSIQVLVGIFMIAIGILLCVGII